jgi:type II secretory pathway component PulJ
MKNRSGITLVEIMLYIVLFSFMALLFNKQMASFINQYTAGKSTAKQQLDARDIILILTSEIQGMGLKIYRVTGGWAIATGVTVSTTDLSSFVHKQGDPNDTLTLYKAELDNNGNSTNITDTIKYYVNGTSLTRNFKATGGTATSGVVAENVYALQFLYGTNLTNTVLFDQSTFTPASWALTNSSGTAPTRANGTNNTALTFSVTATGKLQYSSSLAVTTNQKYLINLTIIPSGSFPKNLDSLNFTFRKVSDNSLVGSEKFLPQKTGNQLTLITNATGNVYASIDYYARGTGSINIQGISATCIELGSYTWMNNPTAITDKQKIKAIRLQMLTRSDQETGVKNTGSVVIGDATVSTSGNYSWRAYDEIIETPNNGSLNISTLPVGTNLTDARIRATQISVNYY